MGRLKACKDKGAAAMWESVTHPPQGQPMQAFISIGGFPSLATPPTMHPCLHPPPPPPGPSSRGREPAVLRSILSLWLPDLQEPWQEAAPWSRQYGQRECFSVVVHAEVRTCKKGRVRNQGKMEKIRMPYSMGLNEAIFIDRNWRRVRWIQNGERRQQEYSSSTREFAG
ncbi:hypothetical protein B296_00051637 [Ensete ventricosum]|uniref:Uncharacterized protein n=1 Tax=Ensete ventricosum TaxID=4639 RepID=A0A426X8B5_ENSVE|nr:hypothetical protein B296_00051637 [Ensete ventricosum]